MQTSCVSLVHHRHSLRRLPRLHDVPFRAKTLVAWSLHHPPSNRVRSFIQKETYPVTSRSPLFVHCKSSESDGETSNDSDPHRGPDKPSWTPWSWITRLATHLRLEQLVLLLFNIQLLFFLLRLWPLSGKAAQKQQQTVNISVPFSEFVSRVKSNDVDAVVMDGQEMTFTLRPNSRLMKDLPAAAETTKLAYKTVRPTDYATPYDVLEQHGVKFSSHEKRGSVLITVMVYALYLGLLLTSFGRLQLKFPQRTIGRKHQNASSTSEIKFDDVAGVDEAKEELEEIVEFLRNPEKFSKLGASPPCGVLLVGPPGTGKTMLAKAVAGEANVPFFSIAASEFVELYVGMGAMRVRELFAQARKEAPSIVFIDEIDAVAKGRDSRLRGVGNDEREQTLNQLLTELDGFETNKDNVVICLAATNRPDVLDAALLRPGRFDRRVSVQQPDRLGREQILKVHIEKKSLPLAEDVTIEGIALPTTGFTGADLANLVNEAALLAGRNGHSKVSREDFDAAILRAMAGIEKKRSLVKGLEKSVVAKHEVGHALVGTTIARLMPGAAEVEKLSIIPRVGGSLGFTYIPPGTEDRLLMFDSEVRAQLAILLGGRAAEMLTCPDVSTGAIDDIKKATSLAHQAISEYGLSKAIGPVNISTLLEGSLQDGVFGRDGGKLSLMVEEEVKVLIDAALSAALDVITENRNIHEGLSLALENEERLEGEALQNWLSHIVIPSSLQQFVLEGTLPNQGDSIDAEEDTVLKEDTDQEQDSES